MHYLVWFALTCALCFLWPASLSSQESAPFVRQHLILAGELLQHGQFTASLEAAKAAEAALKSPAVAPDTLAAETYFRIGKCYLSLGRTDSGKKYLYSALALIGDARSKLRFTIENSLLSDNYCLADALDYFSSPEGKSGQLLAESHLALGRWYLNQSESNMKAKALAEFKHGLRLFETTEQQSSVGAAQSHTLIGYYLWIIDKAYEPAIDHFKKAETIYLQIGGRENNYLAALYVNMGGCFNDMGNPGKGLILFHSALENFLTQDRSLTKITGRTEVHPNLLKLYNNLGNAYKELGEFNLAIQYLTEVVKISPQGRYWNNLGDAYMEKREMTLAENCFHKALDTLLKEKEPDSATIARPYHNLGIIFRSRGKVDSALIYEFKSLPFRKSEGFFTLEVARTYNGIGECYMDLKKYNTALTYFDTALWIQHEKRASGQHPEIASAYLSKARCLFELGNEARAFALTDSSLYAAGYRDGTAFSDIASPLEYLSALGARANLLIAKYKHTSDKTALIRAAEVYRTKAEALQSQRRNLSDDESKSILMRQHFDLYAQAIENNFLIGDVIAGTEAFQYAEQSKGLNLLDVFLKTQARQFAGVPDSVLRREQDLLAQIAETEKTRTALVAGDKQIADSTLKNINSTLLELNRQYQYFLKKLENDYPDLYRLKNDNRAISVTEVQKRLLRPGQTLLEYFVGDTSIFIFLIRHDRFHLTRVPKDFPLAELVQRMQYGIHGFYTAPKNKQTETLRKSTHDDYSDAAIALYQKLIAPVEADLDSALIIIPDPALGEMPFEALLAEKPKSRWLYQTYPFFGKTKTISYCYSAGLLHAMREKKHKREPNLNFLGFAPFFDGDTTQFAAADNDNLKDERLQTLDHSGEEVWRIARTMKGRGLYGSAATFARLRDEGARARILHFSTHGLSDTLQGDNARLWFANPALPGGHEAFFAKDIYPLVLNADLAVFSACQTGVGQLRVGEGVISLARAFAYAGAKSLVNTLWSVREDSTKELMWLFYDNIAAGMPHDRALALAKRTLMTRYQDKGWAHPFFWAGFVGVGM